MPHAPRLRRLLLAFVLVALAAGALARLAGRAEFVRPAWELPAGLVALVVAADVLGALRRGVLGVDIIALLAILGALALGQPLAGVIIALMVSGGTALEEYASARARGELAALLARAPRLAHRRDGAAVADIAADAVRAGDLLLVKPGEIVPVDGTLREGPALLDTAALTGEAIPVPVADGAPVQSGVVNAGAPFSMEATATAEASTYAAVVRLVRQAEQERPPMVRLADRWALGFLGATLALAGAAWAASGDPVRALAVLVVATPCPLILAAPVALICGISRAAARGIVVKGGGALERLARARVGLFDKTGTLTSGTPRLVGVEALEGFDPDAVLRLAAALDQTSQHAVAAAIVAAARGRELTLDLPHEVQDFPGGGIAGIVGETRVMVGGVGLLTGAGLAPPTDGAAARLAAASAAAAWVAIDGRVAGALLLADPVRPEAPRALRALRHAGVTRLVMLSGDRAAAAEAVGRALGLDAVHAELSPAGKIAAVVAERANGVTLMLGDGINDAPALAAADIGVAMGARGAAAAAEAAQVVLTVDRLDRVAEAVGIARRARAIALQSIVAGMGLSGLAMLAAALGRLPPVAGALLQEAIDIAVILNALRVLGGGRARPVSDHDTAQRMTDEHARLRALAERMRQTAARMNRQPDPPIEDLRRIGADLAALLLPHQEAEERSLYPELARRLGGRDPTGSMSRMHEEIAREATRFRAVIDGMKDGGSLAEAQEARRLLDVLDALLSLHLSAEEELLAAAEETGRPG